MGDAKRRPARPGPFVIATLHWVRHPRTRRRTRAMAGTARPGAAGRHHDGLRAVRGRRRIRSPM